MAKTEATEVYCNSCGRFFPKKDFIIHKNELHVEKVHLYCKDCCKNLSQKIMLKYCRANITPDIFSYCLAIRHICSFFDMPYIQQVAEELYDVEFNTMKERNWNYVFQYSAKLKELGYDEDIYWNDLSGNSFIALESIKEKDTRPNSEGDLKLFDDLSKRWGKHIKSLDDFIFLDEHFKMYSEGEKMSAPMINMVKNLCLEELNLLKLRQDKAPSKEINSALKNIDYYYSKLKLDDFKFNKSKSEIEKQLENDIFLIEQHEPIEEGVDVIDLSDRLGIDRDYDNIMRSNANRIVGTKDYPNLKEEDIKKKAER